MKNPLIKSLVVKAHVQSLLAPEDISSSYGGLFYQKLTNCLTILNKDRQNDLSSIAIKEYIVHVNAMCNTFIIYKIEKNQKNLVLKVRMVISIEKYVHVLWLLGYNNSNNEVND